MTRNNRGKWLRRDVFDAIRTRLRAAALALPPISTDMDSESSSQSVLLFLTYALSVAEDAFNKVPGSAVIVRYVKSSHQNDPGRTILELILFLFAVYTLLQSRTRADGKNFIKYGEAVS